MTAPADADTKTEAQGSTRAVGAHTPGPWVVEDDKRNLMVVASGGGFAVIVSEPGRRITKEDRANAALIAAAPELLAGLTAALASIDATRAMLGYYDARDKQRKNSEAWHNNESMAQEHRDMAQSLENIARAALAKVQP